MDQVDVQIPDTAPEGCAVPLGLLTFTQYSQPVKVSIRRSGGQCEDAPAARFGAVRWQRTVTTGPEPSAQASHETFTATFSEAPENQVQPAPPAADRGGICFVRDPPQDGPRCAGTGPRGLSVGRLTLKGLPAGPITVDPGLSFGEVSYTATLPAGSVGPGALQVEAAGGPEVGAFQSSVVIPAPIEITTPLAPGTVIPNDQPFQVAWTGGGPDQVVHVQLISEDAPGTGSGCQIYAPASDGQVTFGLIDLGFPGNPTRLPVQPRQTARVIITVTPRPAAGFSAPGLTRDATHEWSYVFRFTGLRIVAP